MKNKLFLIASIAFTAMSVQAGLVPLALRNPVVTATMASAARYASNINFKDFAVFQKSKEQELEEWSLYVKKPDESLEQAKERVPLEMTKSKTMTLPLSLIGYTALEDSFTYEVDGRHMQEAFNELKKRMHVTEAVDFLYADYMLNFAMWYDVLDRAVYINTNGLRIPPALFVFFIIHELTHVKQHQKMGITGFADSSSFDKEREADSTAAELMQCPLCMKARIAYQLLSEKQSLEMKNKEYAKRGYLTGQDLKKYLEQKSLYNLCKAHKSAVRLDVCSGLDTEEGCKEIIIEDYKTGSILGRLS
jgi:hypothetical protein